MLGKLVFELLPRTSKGSTTRLGALKAAPRARVLAANRSLLNSASRASNLSSRPTFTSLSVSSRSVRWYSRGEMSSHSDEMTFKPEGTCVFSSQNFGSTEQLTNLYLPRLLSNWT